MKRIAAAICLLSIVLSSAAFAESKFNLSINKVFDGRIARCNEKADIGNIGYRLANPRLDRIQNKNTLSLSVLSYTCYKRDNSNQFGLVLTSPSNQGNQNRQVTHHKLLLTNENYQIIAEQDLNSDQFITHVRLVLPDDQDIQNINVTAFIQSQIQDSTGVQVVGSGEFRLQIKKLIRQ